MRNTEGDDDDDDVPDFAENLLFIDDMEVFLTLFLLVCFTVSWNLCRFCKVTDREIKQRALIQRKLVKCYYRNFPIHSENTEFFQILTVHISIENFSPVLSLKP